MAENARYFAYYVRSLALKIVDDLIWYGTLCSYDKGLKDTRCDSWNGGLLEVTLIPFKANMKQNENVCKQKQKTWFCKVIKIVQNNCWKKNVKKNWKKIVKK